MQDFTARESLAEEEYVKVLIDPNFKDPHAVSQLIYPDDESFHAAIEIWVKSGDQGFRSGKVAGIKREKGQVIRSFID